MFTLGFVIQHMVQLLILCTYKYTFFYVWPYREAGTSSLKNKETEETFIPMTAKNTEL
jgi:hypothetical protein